MRHINSLGIKMVWVCTGWALYGSTFQRFLANIGTGYRTDFITFLG